MQIFWQDVRASVVSLRNSGRGASLHRAVRATVLRSDTADKGAWYSRDLGCTTARCLNYDRSARFATGFARNLNWRSDGVWSDTIPAESSFRSTSHGPQYFSCRLHNACNRHTFGLLLARPTCNSSRSDGRSALRVIVARGMGKACCMGFRVRRRKDDGRD